MVQMRTWEEIGEEFTDAILLGNGASIAIDPRFGYSSLLEEAKKSGAVTPQLNDVFEYFKTSDFEYVMEMLWHASHINAALAVNEQRTDNAYREARNALITEVRHVHPDFDDVSEQVKKIGIFLQQFKTVFSLNYDLLNYWAMLNANSEIGGYWFKDCLVNGKLDMRWQRLRTPHRNLGGSTLVFYPHGHLALAVNLYGGEKKIQAKTLSNLLDSIVSTWESGELSPVFVSEGDTNQKINAINRSKYLSTVFGQVLPERKQTLVIYGWAVGRQDSHILMQLKHADIQRCAVSVYMKMNDVDQHCEEVRKKLNLYLGRNVDIQFFDSASEGVWIY